MITFATLFWQPNGESFDFSQAYDESWVEKLYRGVMRNLTQPFRFVCYSDRDRTYAEPIEQRRILSPVPSYADCIQPFELNCPTILTGLDTVITGNIDHLAAYCLSGRILGLPRDPYAPHRACNGVALIPAGMARVAYLHSGQNDMEWVRQFDHEYVDDIFPGHVQSYKGTVKAEGLKRTRIVYFHGAEKPGQIDEPWLADHWK
jgi:hypothetical protein